LRLLPWMILHDERAIHLPWMLLLDEQYICSTIAGSNHDAVHANREIIGCCKVENRIQVVGCLNKQTLLIFENHSSKDFKGQRRSVVRRTMRPPWTEVRSDIYYYSPLRVFGQKLVGPHRDRLLDRSSRRGVSNRHSNCCNCNGHAKLWSTSNYKAFKPSNCV
jgi:hypothetical protein